MIHGAFGVAIGAGLLPLGLQSAVAGHPDILVVEAVELLEEGCAALLAEGLQEDQVLAVLQGGVLDVLHRLEEGRHLSGDLPLLFGLGAA